MKRTGLILIFLLISILAASAIPQLISFQGILKDDLGNPVTGVRQMTFRLYDDPVSGAPLWAETQSVTVEAGLYSVQLGRVSELPLSVFSGSTLYLATAIGGIELSPRAMLISVPYAFRAAYADNAQAGDSLVKFGTGTLQSTTSAIGIMVESQAEGGVGVYSKGVAAGASFEGTQSDLGIGSYSAGPYVGAWGIGLKETGDSAGVVGFSYSEAGCGVWGQNFSSGASAGVVGICDSSYGIGVYGAGGAAGCSFEAVGNGYAGTFHGGRGIVIPNSDGAVTDPVTAEGTIRYHADHFWGYASSGWKQLDN